MSFKDNISEYIELNLDDIFNENGYIELDFVNIYNSMVSESLIHIFLLFLNVLKNNLKFYKNNLYKYYVS
jgi:hypothetical protein